MFPHITISFMTKPMNLTPRSKSVEIVEAIQNNYEHILALNKQLKELNSNIELTLKEITKLATEFNVKFDNICNPFTEASLVKQINYIEKKLEKIELQVSNLNQDDRQCLVEIEAIKERLNENINKENSNFRTLVIGLAITILAAIFISGLNLKNDSDNSYKYDDKSCCQDENRDIGSDNFVNIMFK